MGSSLIYIPGRSSIPPERSSCAAANRSALTSSRICRKSGSGARHIVRYVFRKGTVSSAHINTIICLTADYLSSPAALPIIDLVVNRIPCQSAQARRRAFTPASPIRNSSILRPDLTAATSHLGRLPRPDQVSEVWGFRYFGNTRGYLRRGLPSVTGCKSRKSSATIVPRLSIARRFSSSPFSALIRADKIPLTSP
jgi:hypothetical protein